MITSRVVSKTFAFSHVSTGSQVGYERASETQRSSLCPWTYPLLDASYETRAAQTLFIIMDDPRMGGLVTFLAVESQNGVIVDFNIYTVIFI
jgi:hypothetical protein